MADRGNGEVYALVTVGRQGLRVTIGFENARAAWGYALRTGVAHRARPALIDFDAYFSGRTLELSGGKNSAEAPSGPLPMADPGRGGRLVVPPSGRSPAVSGPDTPAARAAAWARRAREILSHDARVEADPTGVDIIPRDRLRAALLALLEVQPEDLAADVRVSDATAVAYMRGGWSAICLIRTRAGQILTEAAQPPGNGPGSDADGRTPITGLQSHRRTGKVPRGHGRRPPTVGPPASRVRGGDGAAVPTLSTGVGPRFLVLDGAGMVLAHVRGWLKAHALAHEFAELTTVDLPVRVLNTGSLAVWLMAPSGCYRPDPVTGARLPGYVCPQPRPPRRPGDPTPAERYRPARASTFPTVPFLAVAEREAPAEARTRITDELRGFLTTCRAALEEIEVKTMDLAWLAMTVHTPETAATRTRVDRIMTRLTHVMSALEQLAHDE